MEENILIVLRCVFYLLKKPNETDELYLVHSLVLSF